ncbi:MAG: aspartate aminotransferase family protein, partial [Chloroflexota bacterium]
QAKYELIGDARNSGLFGCFELVKDRQTKEPIPAEMHAPIKGKLMAKRLSTLVKEHIIFVGPPLIISEEELHAGLDIIEEVIREL